MSRKKALKRTSHFFLICFLENVLRKTCPSLCGMDTVVKNVALK